MNNNKEEYRQVNTYDENEANKSKKENNSGPIEETASNQFETIAST